MGPTAQQMMAGSPQCMPPEAMGGSVPQSQAPQGQPSQGQKLPPEQMDALRKDPEIIQAVAKVVGKPVDMSSIPDELMVTIAGMIHKLGVDGAIAEFMKMVPPQVIQQMRQGV